MANDESVGSPLHAEPILPVNDILETVNYWHQTLGFKEKWTWGEPPNYGGVAWNGAYIQFSLNPELAAASKGNAIFIKVRQLESLYKFHQKNNATIVEPLENKPWGMAGYTVKDINGYYIVFAGALIHTNYFSDELPSTVTIIERSPTIKEYQYLASSVGWMLYLNDEVVTKLLHAPVFAAVAEDSLSGNIIGCGLVLGDNASFYYVKDLIVHPEWQSKHVGSALMNKLSSWIQTEGANNALVALITGEDLAGFYKNFGFVPAFAMIRYVQR